MNTQKMIYNTKTALIFAGAIILGIGTAYAIAAPSEREQKFIRLGEITGTQIEIHNQADEQRAIQAQCITDTNAKIAGFTQKFSALELEKSNLNSQLFQ